MRKDRTEYFRKWRAENPDRVRAAQEKYDAAHREERRARKRETARLWRLQNLEKHQEARRRTDAKRRKKIFDQKILCACGCGGFLTSINPKPKYIFGHTHRGREHSGFIKAVVSPSVAEIYWVAGFMEGEGTFQHHHSKNSTERVCATQVQQEPLERLQRFLGGKISPKSGSGSNGYNRNSQPAFLWYCSGPRARGVMMTVYFFMSPKRQEQIKKALGGNKWS